MTRETVKMSKDTKSRLEAYRDHDQHTSMDSAVRGLLDEVETPLPTDGIPDGTVPKDAMRVAEHFNIADRVYPLPDVIGKLLGDVHHRTADDDAHSDAPRLNHKFRLFMAGHWFFNDTAVQWGPSYLPHFDAHSFGGKGFLFKLRTDQNGIFRPVAGLPEGEYWFVLDEDASYEESVLAVTQTEGVEFLAPAGGIPDSDEPGSVPPFGGYDDYWEDDRGVVEADGFHDLRTVPEFIAEDGIDAYACQVAHRLKMELTWSQERESDDNIHSMDTNHVALPLDLAVRLHLIGPTMTLAADALEDPATVQDKLDEDPDQLITLPFAPQFLTPPEALDAFYASDHWDSNPNELPRHMYAVEYGARLFGIRAFSTENKREPDDSLSEDELDAFADEMRSIMDSFVEEDTFPLSKETSDGLNTYYDTIRTLRVRLSDIHGKSLLRAALEAGALETE